MSEKNKVLLSWAPPGAVWSKWVKPILFNFMEAEPPAIRAAEAAATGWTPSADGDLALVIDLPGGQGVLLGMEMARHGYRPVPLYNALPWGQGAGLMLLDPSEAYRLLSSTGSRRKFPPPVVDLVPVISAIYHGTGELDRLALPPEAPPAFLLDARRRGERIRPAPGMFDNRSVTSLDDFPPVEALRQQGIRQAVLIQRQSAPREDLAYVLRDLQKSGIEILLQPYSPQTSESWQPQALTVPKASPFADLRYRLSTRLGLKRSDQGFGKVIPEGSGPLIGGRKS